MSVSLAQFEQIDGLMAELIAMGDVSESADLRVWLKANSIDRRLLDACIDAIGIDQVQKFPTALECAASITTRALLSDDLVQDVATCDCGAETDGSPMCAMCAAEYRAELSMMAA